MFMLGEWVRVPAGRNLVFKIKFDKYGGQCGWSGDTKLLETDVPTQTYFVDLAI